MSRPRDGGAARAAQKQLTYLVGGEAGALERARPMLEASAVKIIHAGALGNGAKLKLCLNLITYVQWAAAYESFHLARAVGLGSAIAARLPNATLTGIFAGIDAAGALLLDGVDGDRRTIAAGDVFLAA